MSVLSAPGNRVWILIKEDLIKEDFCHQKEFGKSLVVPLVLIVIRGGTIVI